MKSMQKTLPLIVALLIVLGAPRFGDAQEPCDRSGYQGRVAWFAVPSNSKGYAGYSLGGSKAIRGSEPRSEEGTWGWDYRGIIPSRVMLRWNRGEYHEGSGGTYRVDGKPVPDVPAAVTDKVKPHIEKRGMMNDER
jgi:hypothetical protein